MVFGIIFEKISIVKVIIVEVMFSQVFLKIMVIWVLILVVFMVWVMVFRVRMVDSGLFMLFLSLCRCVNNDGLFFFSEVM